MKHALFCVYWQLERVRNTESRLATCFAEKPLAPTFPRVLPSHTEYAVHPAAFIPGISLSLKLRSRASAPLFIRSTAIVLLRASRPYRGLYHDIATGKPQSARAHQLHGLNCSVSVEL